MGWDDLNPIDAAVNTYKAIDYVKDTVVDKTVDTTVTVASTTATLIDSTKDSAITAFKLQGSITRLGLEKAGDFAQNAAVKVAVPTIAAISKIKNVLGKIDVTPGASNPPSAQGLEFSETKGASKLAYNAKLGEVYKFPDGKKWEVVDVLENEGFFENGFRGIALKSGDKVIVAFAGTDPLSPGDTGTDMLQAVGFAPPQYQMAAAFAEKWEQKAGKENVHLAGHSLGGALASYASVNTGIKATTVNAAPLALTNLGGNPISRDVRNNPNITHYYVPGEVMTALDISNPLDNRPGNTIAVEGKSSILNPLATFSNHTIGNVAPDIPMPEKVN